MESAGKAPKRVRDHHLRQWYVLADLYDRAGDPMAASRWFREIAAREPGVRRRAATGFVRSVADGSADVATIRRVPQTPLPSRRRDRRSPARW